MRTTPITYPALAGLLATLALAPGAARAVECGSLTPAGSTVDLEAGHDYMLSGVGDVDATVSLLAPGGATVASVQVPGGNDVQPGDEFRARYSATYTVRVDPAGSVNAFVQSDCRGSTATLCHLSINHAHLGMFDASSDADWFAADLLAGRTYQISYQGGDHYQGGNGALVGVRDERGRDLVPEQDMVTGGTLTFRPRTKGRYFISITFDDFSGSGSPCYTVGLR